jgi:glycosyltransferase involved in cell wall biosynthesis
MASCPVVSVIIPVYNSESYLEDCLQSVIHQTWESLEIILVNDGSTDRSPDIMRSYAVNDDRIVILSQSNRGVSAARNAGLSIAKGEYIFFVDSDDTIRKDAVEILYGQAVVTDVDIVIGNVYFCYPDERQIPVFRRIAEYGKQSLAGEQCFSQLMEAYVFPPLVYLYFTKRAFLQKNGFFFEEGIVHEDELWCIKTLIYAQKVSVMDFYHYYYRVRKGSIMHSDNKKYRVYSFFRVINSLEAFATELQEKQKFIGVIGYIYVRIFYIYHSICELLQEMKEKTNEHRAYFERLLKKIYPALSCLQQQACSNYFNNGNRLLYTRSSGLTLSFCVTCMNRFYQIKQTLRRNLDDNKDDKDIIEFVLVDFGSTDGLQQWVTENFMNEIEEGYLKYYYTEELSYWHTPIAKNTAHILASNLIVVNLDCDNFTGKSGGIFVIDNMIKYGWDKTILHQFGNEYNDGSHGRIALSKSNFLMLGGYDESLEPSSYDDNDLLLRAQLMRLNYINLPDMRYNRAILNTHEELMVNTGYNMSWEEMDERNFQLSVKNITSGKLKANIEKDHIGIVDNMYTFQDE